MRSYLVTAALMILCITALGTAGAARPVPSEADWHQLVLGIAQVPYQRAGLDDPEVRLAAVPDGFRTQIHIPSDARVHGSLVQPDGSVTVVATVRRSVEELWREFELEMPALGWRLPDQASGRADKPLPAGPPYAGDGALGACAGFPSTIRSASTSISSTLSFQQLRAHYEAQLHESGWTRAEERDEPARMLDVWGRAGASAVFILEPAPGRPGCWSVSFNQLGKPESVPVQ